MWKKLLPVLAALMLVSCASPETARTNTRDSGSGTNAVAATGAKLPSEYVLRPDDVVHVFVYQEPDLEAKGLKIAKDGTITLSLLQRMPIGGKTVEEAQKTIRDAYAKNLLVNPQVTLQVLEYAKRVFTVLGHVERRGTYEIPPGEESINILQAISKAGGPTRIGNLKKVTVQRGEGPDKQVFGPLNVEAMMKNKSTQIFEIFDGDTITVDEKLI